MLVRISTGAEVEVDPGDLILAVPGYLPSFTEGRYLTVEKVENGHIYVRFLQEEKYFDSENIERTKTLFDELSTVHPSIIKEVL